MTRPPRRSAIATAASALALVAGVAVGVACGRGNEIAAPSTAAAGVAAPIDEPTVDDPTAALVDAVVDLYDHVGLGNLASYVDTLSRDLPLALIGVTADAVVVGIAPRGAARDRRIFAALEPVLLAKNLDVALGADGSVGWVFDELSYRVAYRERVASIPVRQTSVWVRDFDRWVEVVEHWSYAVPIADLRRQAAAGRLPPPVGFPRSPRGPADGELLRRVAAFVSADDPGRAALFVAGRELVVLLPDGEHRGADAARAPSVAALVGPGTIVGLRDHRVAVDRSGTLAWVVANLGVATAVNDRPVEFGLRGSWVFVRTGDDWRIVQAHVSAPVTEAELERRVFGTE